MIPISKICAELLQELFGEDILKDPNFKDTPKRMAKMYANLFDCSEDIDLILTTILSSSFPSNYDGLIILPNIRTISFCPHHMLPVEYKIIIAYLPNTEVIGASKPERVACVLAKRPILQEDYNLLIANSINTAIKPKGVAVIIQGFHSCMRIRGIKNPCANMITSKMKGAFLDNPRTQSELFQLIRIGEKNG